MKIQCDVCEAPATVICCADEAALCGKCDVEVHAANKVASKHQRLILDECLSNKLPKCDICQEKTAFIFCVEDRALFCKDCDEPTHAAGSRSANHQRFLATGIRVALNSGCNDVDKSHLELPKPPSQTSSEKVPPQQSPSFVPSWAVEDLIQFPEFESSDKKEQLEFGEFEWPTDMDMFGEYFGQETLAAAEVPQLPGSYQNSNASYRTNGLNMGFKKQRIESTEDLDDYFTVPDLG